MEKVFATPAAGMRVRKQDRGILAENGEPVERNAFWIRRERDGDVTLTALAVMPQDLSAPPASMAADTTSTKKK